MHLDALLYYTLCVCKSGKYVVNLIPTLYGKSEAIVTGYKDLLIFNVWRIIDWVTNEKRLFSFQLGSSLLLYSSMRLKNTIFLKIKNAIREVNPETEIILFGSQARNEANDRSDWDLLILIYSDSINFEEETAIMDGLYEIELETGELISPLIYTKSDWENRHRYSQLYQNIHKEGIKIK